MQKGENTLHEALIHLAQVCCKSKQSTNWNKTSTIPAAEEFRVLGIPKKICKCLQWLGVLKGGGGYLPLCKECDHSFNWSIEIGQVVLERKVNMLTVNWQMDREIVRYACHEFCSSAKKKWFKDRMMTVQVFKPTKQI